MLREGVHLQESGGKDSLWRFKGALAWMHRDDGQGRRKPPTEAVTDLGRELMTSSPCEVTSFPVHSRYSDPQKDPQSLPQPLLHHPLPLQLAGDLGQVTSLH